MKPQQFKYIYGPVPSWRLGSSLGIDLLSREDKICVFDCVYCQLGSNAVTSKERRSYVPTEEIIGEIKRLPKGLIIDYITFSGGGEPTLAANLGDVIKKIRDIRREKIAVITDSSLMRDKAVRNELGLADLVIAKLDAPSQELFEKINRPAAGISFKDVFEGIKSFLKESDAMLAVQIMFIDMNKAEYRKLAQLAFEIGPDEIEINTPLRPCGVKPLSKHEIADIKKYFEEEAKRLKIETRITVVYDAEPRKIKAMSSQDTLRRRGQEK